MANGSVMMETVNDIRDALGGDGSSPETVLNGSELMSTVLEIKDLVESGSGGGGGGFLVHVLANESDNTLSLDKNYNEIKAAVLNGIFPAFVVDSELEPPDEGFVVPSLSEYGYDGSKEEYYITLRNQSQAFDFTSASATGEMKTEPLG